MRINLMFEHFMLRLDDFLKLELIFSFLLIAIDE